MAKMMWGLLPMPLSDITRMIKWRTSRFRNIGSDNSTFKQSVKKVDDMLLHTNVFDLFDHYRVNEPIFNINANYMTTGKSARMIAQWLQFQFGDNWLEFLETAYKVILFQKIGDENSILVDQYKYRFSTDNYNGQS